MLYIKIIQISKSDKLELFNFLYNLSCLSKALYNQVIFYINNTMTGLVKQEYPEERFHNETEVLHNVFSSLSKQNKYKYPTPDKWFLSYNELDFIFKTTLNESYYNLPSQLNQQVIKQVINNYKIYFSTLKDYKKHPNKYKTRPKKPKYKKEKTITYTLTINYVKFNIITTIKVF